MFVETCQACHRGNLNRGVPLIDLDVSRKRVRLVTAWRALFAILVEGLRRCKQDALDECMRFVSQLV
jgi:hypothetical protein